MTFRWNMSWRSRESTAKAGGGSPSPAWTGLSLAIAAPLAITALKLALPEQLGYATPFLLYFGATLVGAWFGGLLGGSVAVALSALLGSYFFLLPLGALVTDDWQTWVRPGAFVLEGLAISWVTVRLQSERARAVTRAHEAQVLVAKLESVLASVEDGITVQDPHGKLLYANQRAASLLGYPSTATLLAAPLPEVMGRFDLRSPDGSRFPLADLPGRKVLQDLPAPEQLVRLRVLASGDEHWSRLRAAPVRLPGGEVEYAVNVFHDLTELRRREEALRVSQVWFATALQSVGDAVIAADAQGAVTFMNPLAERLCGWTSAEATGKPLAEVFHVVHEATRAPIEDPVARVLREGKLTGLTQHCVLSGRHGGEVAIDDSVAPIRSAEGEAVGVVLVFRDVTQKRIEEQEFSLARDRAEWIHRTKDEFLAVLAQELRDPLAPIAAALHLIKERRSKTIAKEVAVIERQVRHMTSLVDDLQDVSRVTGGKVPLLCERSPLLSIVAKAVELAEPLLRERQHELIITVPDELHVDCDAARLAQAFSNLLGNAAKYTPRRGRIEISANSSGDEVMLRVRDDGVGIEPELLPHVFELFVQGSPALDRPKGGLGLGLSIVRSLVELHGGQVSAHSDGTGKGSEFRVYLPLSRERDEVLDMLTGQDARARLLIVDDNADALQLLSQALRRLGHEVHVAEDAVGALAAAAMFEADIALLDVGLPVIDGYQLASQLRAIPGWQDVKLVALTGYGQTSEAARAHEAGFDEHLIKPISVEDLSNVVTRLSPPV